MTRPRSTPHHWLTVLVAGWLILLALAGIVAAASPAGAVPVRPIMAPAAPKFGPPAGGYHLHPINQAPIYSRTGSPAVPR